MIRKTVSQNGERTLPRPADSALDLQGTEQAFQISLAIPGLCSSLEPATDQLFGRGTLKEARPCVVLATIPVSKGLRGGAAFLAAAITPSGKAAMLRASRSTKPSSSAAGSARLIQP